MQGLVYQQQIHLDKATLIVSNSRQNKDNSQRKCLQFYNIETDTSQFSAKTQNRVNMNTSQGLKAQTNKHRIWIETSTSMNSYERSFHERQRLHKQ